MPGEMSLFELNEVLFLPEIDYIMFKFSSHSALQEPECPCAEMNDPVSAIKRVNVTLH